MNMILELVTTLNYFSILAIDSIKYLKLCIHFFSSWWSVFIPFPVPPRGDGMHFLTVSDILTQQIRQDIQNLKNA